jgi:hypothetical protein
VPEAKRVVVKKGQLGGPLEDLVAKIGKRVAAFGREAGGSGHGNRNKRILVEVPEASAHEILAVLAESRPMPMPMPPIIYFNIGWMKNYAGAKADDQTVGGHGWLDDHEHGLECFNFLPAKGGQLQGYRPPGSREKVNIDRLGANPSDDLIDGILVVWLAREPGSGKTLVAGWYRDATVYRECKTGQFRLYKLPSEYSVSTSKENAVLVPVGARGFEVQSSRTAPGGGFGQKPTWYGSPDVDNRVWAYVNSWDDAKKRPKPGKGKRPPKNTDPELRRKVEKAAVRHAWEYYEAKYGKGCDIQSVEPYGRGWDLEVRCGEQQWLVEVKGLLNANLACELTPNEHEKMNLAENCQKYIVYVVNNALAEEPEAPIPSIFEWQEDGKWRTDDGRELQVAEKVGAVLTCKQPPGLNAA